MVLEAAGDMKVVLLNRPPADMSILNENAVYVGSDNFVAGRYQGEWLANYFNSKNQKDIKYLLLEGMPGTPTTVQRTNAVLNTLQENGINAVEASPPIAANYLREEALYKIFPVLTSGVEFDTIISNNDAMALGAIAALKDLNMDPSATPIVGVDATYPAVQALLQGDLAMTVFQNSKEQGYTAITMLINMLSGYPIDTGTIYKVSEDNPYSIYIPFELVTVDNFPLDLEYVAPAPI
jgi:ABC-type sugar transport system substrate-binding protein